MRKGVLNKYFGAIFGVILVSLSTGACALKIVEPNKDIDKGMVKEVSEEQKNIDKDMVVKPDNFSQEYWKKLNYEEKKSLYKSHKEWKNKSHKEKQNLIEKR